MTTLLSESEHSLLTRLNNGEVPFVKAQLYGSGSLRWVDGNGQQLDKSAVTRLIFNGHLMISAQDHVTTKYLISKEGKAALV